VASCCPFKKSKAPADSDIVKQKSPVTTDDKNKMSNSQKKNLQKQLENAQGGTVRDGSDNTQNARFQRHQPKFLPRQVQTGNAGTSGAPAARQTNASPSKYLPPHLQKRHQSPQGDRNFSRNNNQSFHNTNDHRDRHYPNGQHFSRNYNNQHGYSNHGRCLQNFQRSPNGRQFQRNNHFNNTFSPQRSRTSNQCDGYLKEFTFVENGKPKTVMAWVPLIN